MLDWFTALLIGFIQGTLEWLPVSSSGQTTLVMVDILQIHPEYAISFGLAVHIGTAAAVFARYPKQLLQVADIRSFSSKKRFYWATTLLSLLMALPLLLLLEATFDSNLWTGVTITFFIGIALVFTGIILGWRSRTSLREISSGSLLDYFLVAIAQAFAVLPGVSRSGMTVSALLMRRFQETEALVFSFLLSVPVSIASFVYFVVFGNMGSPVALKLLAIAGASAFVFGYFSMSVLVQIARNARFSGFCMFFGCLAVFFALFLWAY